MRRIAWFMAHAAALTLATSCSDETVRSSDSALDLRPADAAGDRDDLPRADGSGDAPGADGGGSCAAIATFADEKQPTAIIHVSPGGSDSSGTGSAAKPFATISRAAKLAKPGTAVRVHAGTYSGGNSISGLTGAAGAPIWIGGAPGEARPVISGGAEGIHLTKVRHLVLHDLEVKNSTSNGINCDDGGDRSNADATRHVVFRKLYVHDIGSAGNQDCLKLSGVDDYFVLDSKFSSCGGGGSGSAIDHVGCHGGLIARNTFEDLSGNAVQNKGGSANIEIRWNVMKDAGVRAVNIGGSTGFAYFRPPLSTGQPNAEARKIRVVANVIVGSDAPLAFVGCVDCLAANNTIIDPGKWLIRILQETTTSAGYTFLPASKGAVVNNIFYFDRAKLSTYINIGNNTQASSFAFSNNLWFAHDSAARSKPTLPVTETGAVIGKDPAFAKAAAGDYSIGSSSPAAAAGKPPAPAPGDITGACFGSPPSIGAYAAK